MRMFKYAIWWESAFAARKALEARTAPATAPKAQTQSPAQIEISNAGRPENGLNSRKRKSKRRPNGPSKKLRSDGVLNEPHSEPSPDRELPGSDTVPSPAVSIAFQPRSDEDDYARAEIGYSEVDSDVGSNGTASAQSATLLGKTIESTKVLRFSSLSRAIDHEGEDQQSVRLELHDGDVLTIIGQYDLTVQTGTVGVLGAKLHVSPKLHRIYAPSTHALPSIRCLRNPFGPSKPARIVISSVQSGLCALGRLNPMFRNIWNYDISTQASDRSFKILETSADDTAKRALTTFEPGVDWQAKLVEILDQPRYDQPTMLICGPKGSGKSSFAKYLANALLAKPASTGGIAFLDLDPGQPEYSVPGEISLLHLRSFSLGPSFTHSHVPELWPNKLVRSHHIGYVSPNEDVNHYMRCTFDLLNTYTTELRSLGCPLLINSCGWIHGSGAEVLEKLIRTYPLTEVLYTSKEGPTEVVEALRKATNEVKGCLFTTLSSKDEAITAKYGPEARALAPSRTSSQLRLMQTLSYLHSDEPEGASARWDATPLYMRVPQTLHYAGDDPEITGIMVLGNEMNANVLKTVINGSILGLVAIEDGSALPTSPTKNADAEERFSREMSSSDCDSLATFAIRRSAEEALPYLFIGHCANTPLDPTRTRSIGQVLVRSINKRSRTLSILTPVSMETIRTLRAEGIALVLVRGRLDTPGWAYTEEYYEGLAATRDRKRQREYQKEYRLERESDEDREGEDGMEAENDEFDVESWLERTPWVEEVPSRRGLAPAAAPAAGAEEQSGLQNGRNNTSSGATVSKTGVGGGGGGGGGEKVWKVRRNLMTSEGKRRREGGGGGGGGSAKVKSSQKD